MLPRLPKSKEEKTRKEEENQDFHAVILLSIKRTKLGHTKTGGKKKESPI